MSLRPLFRSTLAYSLNTLIAPLFSMVLTPLYTRVLTPEDFGALGLIRSLGMIISVFGMLGMITAMSVLLYKQSDEESRLRLLSTALWLGIICSTLLMVVALFVVEPLALIWLGDLRFAPMIFVYLLNLPFGVIYTLQTGAFRLRQEAFKATAVGLAQIVLLAVGNLVLVVWLRAGLMGALAAEMCTYVGLSLLCLLLAPEYVLAAPRALLQGWSVEPVTRRLLLAGVPLIPMGLANWALNYIDRPLLLQMGIGLDQIGIYDIAAKLASLLTLLSIPFQQAWIPFALSIQEQSSAAQTYARTLIWYLAGMLGMVLGLSLFAREIIMVFTTPMYLPAYRYVWLLGSAAPIIGSQIILTTGLYITGKTAHLAWTTMVGAAVNIGLNLLLVPVLGVAGAAIATPLGYLCGPIAAVIVAQRYYAVPYQWRPVFLLLTIQMALVVAGLWFSQETSVLSVGVRLLFLLMYPVMLIGLGMISLDDLARGQQLIERYLRWG
ncbi:MAG: oligosaccharide flippase family protein [Chloroflexaceae bacterium]|nr:oligosaccharide flippase family protein [Chloroflexaceae bacterium]